MNENSIESFDLLISLLNQADQEADRLLGLMATRQIGISDDMARYAVKSAFEGFGVYLWGYDEIKELKDSLSTDNVNHLSSVVKKHHDDRIAYNDPEFLSDLARTTTDIDEQRLLAKHSDNAVRAALLKNPFLHSVARNILSKGGNYGRISR